MKDIIKNAKSYVKEIFENDFSGHDYFHTSRVYNNAMAIAQKENANELIVGLAALLHDVDDVKLSPMTSENKDRARKFLKDNNISEEIAEEVIDIINNISFSGSGKKVPGSIEGKIVQDADRLDAIGAIGIARTLTFGGNKNRVLYDPDIKPSTFENEAKYRSNNSTTINHFYEKLLLLKDLMNTKTAKEIADKRHEFMEQYLDQFFDEWNGLR